MAKGKINRNKLLLDCKIELAMQSISQIAKYADAAKSVVQLPKSTVTMVLGVMQECLDYLYPGRETK